jgi:peptidoglycan hydrolase-like protein with peptidoglycan-binding domain
MMKLGDRGLHVTKVQNALNAKVVWGTSPKLIPDGIFGSRTFDAVRAFQKQKGLPVTGVVDNAMAVKLGLFPSDILPPPVKATPSVIGPAVTSPGQMTPGISSLEKFYTFMGGKTMAMIGVAILGAGIVVSYFAAKKSPKPQPSGEKA